jgi:uncharacterized protein
MTKIKHQTLHVKGMHCASCEILIEKQILKFKGVKSVNAMLADNKVEINYDDNKLSIGQLNQKFKKMGYSFSENEFKKSSPSVKSGYLLPLIIAIVFFLIFLGFQRLNLISFVKINSEGSVPAFFVFGIIAGLSSCAALVGGLVLSLAKKWSDTFKGNRTLLDRMKPHFLFNLGRVLAYGLFGALLGLIGQKIQISHGVFSILIVIVSIIMTVLALQLLEVKALDKFHITLPKSLSHKITNDSEIKGKYVPFTTGFLTLLLPCGFTLIAESSAILSGNAWSGGLLMFAFALGTSLPLMLIGLSSVKFLKNIHLSNYFSKAAGFIILFFVIFNLNNQFNFSQYFSKPAATNSNVNTNRNGNVNINQTSTSQNLQIIKTTYTEANDIQPNSFEVKVGQPVRFEVDVKDDGSGCMSTIMVQGLYNQSQLLRKGDVLVMEFTPQRTGEYQITCAMGVPRGTISVKN